MDFLAEEVSTFELTESYITQSEDAFRDSIQQLADEINIPELETAIESFDLDAAVEATGVDEQSFSLFELVLATVWTAGVVQTYKALNATKELKKKLTVAIHQNNEMNAAYADLVQSLIKGLAEEQRGAVRATILSGHSMQKRSRDIARDIAGRYDPVAKRRVGGLIGLDNRQADTQAKLEIALRDGDKKVLRRYLKLKTRDARYDAWVRTRIDGGSLSSQQQQTILSRYADRALYYRAKRIADDSVRTILATAQARMIEQQIFAGNIDATLLTKVWHTMEDVRVRLSHQSLRNKEVPYSEQFFTLRGTPLLHPHDPKAPWDERVGCRCWLEYRLKGKKIGRSGFRGF